jgi:uncharacterized Zn-finger protein
MAEQSTEFRCDICGATFKEADALTKHRAIHDTSKQDNEDLEQGTEKPTQNPSMPVQPPGPGPAL